MNNALITAEQRSQPARVGAGARRAGLMIERDLSFRAEKRLPKALCMT